MLRSLATTAFASCAQAANYNFLTTSSSSRWRHKPRESESATCAAQAIFKERVAADHGARACDPPSGRLPLLVTDGIRETPQCRLGGEMIRSKGRKVDRSGGRESHAPHHGRLLLAAQMHAARLLFPHSALALNLEPNPAGSSSLLSSLAPPSFDTSHRPVGILSLLQIQALPLAYTALLRVRTSCLTHQRPPHSRRGRQVLLIVDVLPRSVCS